MYAKGTLWQEKLAFVNYDKISPGDSVYGKKSRKVSKNAEFLR
jgi:hypothetical protein